MEISVGDAKGDGEDDFSIDLETASGGMSSVVSRHPGDWEVIGFGYELDDGSLSSVSFGPAYFDHEYATIHTLENDCDPACYNGTRYERYWTYFDYNGEPMFTRGG